MYAYHNTKPVSVEIKWLAGCMGVMKSESSHGAYMRISKLRRDELLKEFPFEKEGENFFVYREQFSVGGEDGCDVLVDKWHVVAENKRGYVTYKCHETRIRQ